MGLTLMHQAFTPLTFWPYTFATTVYLINRMPKVGFSLGSSFEKLFHKALDLSKLRVFGCLCFPWLVPILPTNSIPSPVLVSFLVTPSLKVPFSVLTLPSKKIFVSRHVKFVENVFPFVSLSTSTTLVIDTTFALPTSSFPLCEYSSLPPPPPPTYITELT